MIAKPTINSPLPCRYCKLPVYWVQSAKSGKGDYKSIERNADGFVYQCEVNFNHEPGGFEYYLKLCK